jgi:hypothetical protein
MKPSPTTKEPSTTPIEASKSLTSLPGYYDPESSSRPPPYSHSTTQITNTRPSNPHSGASAAQIAAILAYPSEADIHDQPKDKRSLRERWRDWKARVIELEVGGPVQVSGPTLNVQGIGVRSWTNITPREKRMGR